MDVEFSIDIMKYLSCSDAISCRKNSLFFKRVAVYSLNILRANKERVSASSYTVLGVSAAGSDRGNILDIYGLPICRNKTSFRLPKWTSLVLASGLIGC